MNFKKISRLISLLLSALLLSGCSPAPAKQSATFFAMDTIMSVTWYGDASAGEELEAYVEELEHRISVTDENSEIYALNNHKSTGVSADTGELIDRSLSMCAKTDGALDITVQPLIEAWGFGTDSPTVPEEEKINTLLDYIGYRKINIGANGQLLLPDNLKITLGATAKGFTSDKLAEMLKEKGISSALLNLGGNVYAVGRKPDGSKWKIAIADPKEEASYAASLEIADQAVITSGSYERFFEENGKRYHHILDPATGYPSDSGLISVTVIGNCGLECDALSTALFVMGPEKAVEFWQSDKSFDFILITDDNSFIITPGISDCFTPLGSYSSSPVTVLE